METLAVVMQEPERLTLSRLALTAPGPDDLVVDIRHSGISTGTEKLLWTGKMPMFPGMGYPLVPGYESVGVVAEAAAGLRAGDHVFVPGAKCFGDVRGLFGGAAQRVVVPASRVLKLDSTLGERGVLLALTATAYHAYPHGGAQPDLIVGHGVLGRLMARLAVVAGASPTVWELNPDRMSGAEGYQVIHPEDDKVRNYRSICDMSGDPKILDRLVQRLAPGGEIVLAGFYTDPLSFNFAPAFMREARIRIAAQFLEADQRASLRLIEDGRLSLDGLITHRAPALDADAAYRTAFTDAACLKMILDWSHSA
jgi:3-hydroxyethyl bacteriochlorophyllide a dehydrogenase